MENAPIALVVEDDPGVSEFVASVLAEAGWRVLTLARGDEVLETVRRERPNVVLLDVQIPGLDGFTVLAQLRADAELAGLRIVVVSGESPATHEPIAKFLGADRFLGKPVSAGALRRAAAESRTGSPA